MIVDKQSFPIHLLTVPTKYHRHAVLKVERVLDMTPQKKLTGGK